MPAKGTRTAYRSRPANFVEVFVRVGWGGAEAELHAHKRNIKRWLAEVGEDAVCALRRAYLTDFYGDRGYGVPGRRPGARSAKRYVLGQTLRRDAT